MVSNPGEVQLALFDDKGTVEVSYGAKANSVTFHSYEEILDWITKEREFWVWLGEPPVSKDPQVAALWTQYNRNLQTADGLAKSLQEKSQTDEARNRLEAELKNAFENLGILTIPSNSTYAKFVDLLRRDASAGPLSAAAALAVRIRPQSFGDMPQFLANSERFQGIISAILHDEGVSGKAVKSSAASLEELSKKAGELLVKQRKEFQQLKDAAIVGIDTFSTQRAEAIEALKMSLDDVLSNFMSEKAKIAADMEGVKRQYSEFMELEGPVSYWSTRANDHAKRLKHFTWAVSVSSLLGASLLIVLYIWIGSQIQGDIKIDHFLFLALGLVCTTIVFWIVRVFLKIVLSERHLKTMAEEKSVLIKTYLALTKVNEGAKEDRHIVLSAIFHMSSDGIVKDDGAPDISAAALLSKFMARSP
jgi:Family of unknown function (DUF6161)